MKIKLDKQDIIKEIDENYRNDVDLIFDIVADTTTSWEPVRELIKRLIQYLKDNYEDYGISTGVHYDQSDIEETFNTKIEMKTPIQELHERVKEYRDSENSPLVISRLNSICVDIFGMLDKEKEVIKNAYIEGCGDNILCESTDKKRAEEYYNETFNTKEK